MQVSYRVGWLLALVAASPLPLAAQETGPVIGVEQRLEELDQKVRILERLLELSRDSAATAAKSTPKVLAGREGFSFASPDGDFLLKLRGYVQADGRDIGGLAPGAVNSTLLLRRVRPIVELTAWRYFSVRVMPDFGGGKVVLYDAYLDLRPTPALGLRVGKTKPPVGLERLQSASDLRFVERGLPTNLVPNRDVGAQLFGDLAHGRVSYSLGLFNGVPDLGLGDGDVGGDKDVVARLFVQPFLDRAGSSLRGLGFGVAASRGEERGTITASNLASYVTSGQQSLFRYRDSTIADGRRARLSPQAWYHAGRLGLLAELVRSEQVVSRGATQGVRLRHTGWQLSGSWYLTGERAGFGAVAPKRPFDLRTGGLGALELGARYGELHLDRDAFPLFANSANSARRASAAAIALTWHFTRGEQIGINYERTRFHGGAADGDRRPEHALLVRLQQSF